jgi:hypothetical protein
MYVEDSGARGQSGIARQTNLTEFGFVPASQLRLDEVSE